MPAALVTGASTGLGRELAGLFAADGHDVVLVSSERSAAALDELADRLRAAHGVAVETVNLDLAVPEGAERLVDVLDERGLVVDHLVNNAGVGIVGLKVHEYDVEEVRRLLDLNVRTLTELTVVLGRRMVERGQGRILNVSSIAAYVAPHGLEAAYSASKAYVRAFSESVAHDLRGTGVTCTHLAPGPTRTEFFGTAGLADDSRLDRAYLDAAVVARAGYDAMRAGRRTVMPGTLTRLMRLGATLSPSRRLVGDLSGFFVERRH